MKRSEQLVRAEIAAMLGIVCNDSIDNFHLAVRAISTIQEDELDGYDVEKLRDGAAYLLDAAEQVMLGVIGEDATAHSEQLADAAIQFKRLREELAAA
jgi:hypothetical protein